MVFCAPWFCEGCAPLRKPILLVILTKLTFWLEGHNYYQRAAPDRWDTAAFNFPKIDTESARLLETAIDKLGLSARAWSRILKIVRTIADLEGINGIESSHIAEAIQYQNLDRGKRVL